MNKPSRKTDKNNGAVDLISTQKQSHNGLSHDERIIALVKFLARRAAEDDYRKIDEAQPLPDKTQGGT